MSTGFPLVFLWIVRSRDLYATASYRLLAVSFVGGLLAFPAAFVVNTVARDLLLAFAAFTAVSTMATVKTIVAPITEEVLKSLGVIRSVRHRDFTYFVDGAICGFAAGTAFAVLENIFYLTTVGPDQTLGLSIARSFSTSLMHGTASALVGVSVGRARFGHGTSRLVALLLGWAAAIALHAAYNSMLVFGTMNAAKVAAAVAIGLGGVVLTMAFIVWGLREEQAWLRQSLGLDIGVSQSESAVVLRLADLDALLQPVEQRFGPEKRKQVEAFLRLQARMGLKRQARDLTQDDRLREQLDGQIGDMRIAIDENRRKVGVYCMVYVRSILPPETGMLWDRLSEILAEERPATIDMYATLAERTEPGGTPKPPDQEGAAPT